MAEQNVVFVLQKSRDGKNWRDMGRVGEPGGVEDICKALRLEPSLCRYRVIERKETVVF